MMGRFVFGFLGRSITILGFANIVPLRLRSESTYFYPIGILLSRRLPDATHPLGAIPITTCANI
jgi:hypothetical protein